MSKVTVALGSFIVGACCAFIISSLPHTSTRVQASQHVGVDIPGAEPIVPPLNAHFIGGNIGGDTQALDGLDCNGCTITAPLITYGGGAFTCGGCTIHTSRVVLKGAALNTFNALAFFGVIPRPKAAPNKPKPPMAEANEIQIVPQEKVDWVTLAGLKQ
jgi:hypothetical protein